MENKWRHRPCINWHYIKDDGYYDTFNQICKGHIVIDFYPGDKKIRDTYMFYQYKETDEDAVFTPGLLFDANLIDKYEACADLERYLLKCKPVIGDNEYTYFSYSWTTTYADARHQIRDTRLKKAGIKGDWVYNIGPHGRMLYCPTDHPDVLKAVMIVDGRDWECLKYRVPYLDWDIDYLTRLATGVYKVPFGCDFIEDLAADLNNNVDQIINALKSA